MGSSSSRLGARPSRARENRSNRSSRAKLSSFICGGSSSHAPLEMENYTSEVLVYSGEHGDTINNEAQNPVSEPTLISSTGTVGTSLHTLFRTSIESSDLVSDDISGEDGSRNIELHKQGKCLSENKELVAPHQVSVDYSHDRPYSGRSRATTSTSFKELQSSDPVSVNVSANKNAVNGINNSVNKGVSEICPEIVQSSSSSSPGLCDPCSYAAPVENHVDEVSQVTAINDSDSVPHVSNLPVNFRSLRDDLIQEAIPSGLGVFVSNREQSREDRSMLHVDLVSISSHILSSSNADPSHNEVRRNSRRLFWDAFSRRNSRRHIDSPPIVFSTGDTDDLGERWLLDFSGDFFDDGVGGDSAYMDSRIRSSNGRRWHSRSMLWERLRGDLDENGRRATMCPSGLHFNGACSCESFSMTEESSTRASISRIVMLAEALFEVLDEIHRQPVSLSLSMVSLPAPESVVDSFPLKNHKKVDTAAGRDNIEQCYICLAEYEDGEKIRVLPCNHEYHMSCVDKWLKEIHGVCPLCRGDVRKSATECSVINSEIHSL